MTQFEVFKFAVKLAKHQKELSSFSPFVSYSFNGQSKLLEWLLESKEEHNYVTDMSYQGYIHLVFQCVATVLHLFLSIPSNVLTLVVIGNTKSLWTLSNMVFVINAFFMAMTSVTNCMFRLSHFPLFFFNEQNRIIAYRVGWWLNFVYFRVGNFRYRYFISRNYFIYMKIIIIQTTNIYRLI